MPSQGQEPHYLANYDAFLNQDSFEAMYACVPPQKTGSVHLLDVMAAIGHVGRNIAQRIQERMGKTVHTTYLDLYEVMLAHPLYQPADVRVHADVLDTPFPPEIADIVTVRCGLNNLCGTKWEPAIAEMMRIVRSGGTVILQDHFPLDDRQRREMDDVEQRIALFEGRPNIPCLKTLGEVEGLFKKYGGDFAKVNTIDWTFDMRKRLEKKEWKADPIELGMVTYPVSTVGVRKR